MLGENHLLYNEFPAYKANIIQLNQVNREFAKDAKHYHLLDTETRTLEPKNVPIHDDALHQMKQERAVSKIRSIFSY